MHDVIEVGSRRIGRGQRCFVVAEIACAHEGSARRAIGMIEALADSGVDAIQLQLFRAEELMARSHPEHDLVQGLEIPPDDWREVLIAARRAGPQLWANVFDVPSLELALTASPDLLKVHSTDIGHPDFLSAVASVGLPVSLATGGSTDDELLAAVEVLRGADVPFLLMHGYQAYPTPVAQAELARLAVLRSRFGCPVGFADHADGSSRMAWLLPAAAIGAGADVIEKHVVDDRMAGGIDHEAAIEPHELALLCSELHTLDRGIGSGLDRSMSSGERSYRQTFKRTIVAARPIEVGEIVERDALTFLRAGEGLAPREIDRVVGHVALREIEAHEAIHAEDVLVTDSVFDAPRVVACIAVRMHSQRLPQKALLPIDGVPMLKRLIDRLRTAVCVDEIVVCTSDHPDDQVLVDRAIEWGASAYAGSEQDVLSRFIEAGEQAGADLVVRITGDNVLTDPASIDALVDLQQAEGADYARVSGVPLGVTPEVMTLDFLRRLHDEMEDPSASEYLIFFAFDPERYRCSVLYASPETDRPDYALTVDTPADLELMERLYRAIPCGVAGPSIAEVCRLLDEDPDYHGVPSDAPIKLPDGKTLSFAEYLSWHRERSEICTAIEVTG